MAFLIIDGITVPASISGVVKKAPEQAGSSSRAFSGALRSTVRWTKRSWQVTTRIMIETDAAAIETSVVAGAYVSCSGDLLGGSITCLVTVGDSPVAKVSTAAGGRRRALTLLIREV